MKRVSGPRRVAERRFGVWGDPGTRDLVALSGVHVRLAGRATKREVLRSEVVREGRVELPRPFGHRILGTAARHGSWLYVSSCVIWRRACVVR